MGGPATDSRLPAFGRSLRRGIAASVAIALAVIATLVFAPSIARADGPTTFSNTASIDIPAIGSPGQAGPASPYPSTIAVAGMAGTVTAVQVVFHDLTHSVLSDIDALVVAPTGESLVLLSDVGFGANDVTLTFDDSAAGAVPPGSVSTGTYQPTNMDLGGTLDTFPAPAPAPSTQTTLAGAFDGIDPNGSWQLYIVDDATGDVGTMAGGWSLIITTQVVLDATTTTLTTSSSPSTVGSPVTFTATVTSGGSPVTEGSVKFTVDGAFGATVAVNGSGIAQFTTSALAEGTRDIEATYSATSTFDTSSDSLQQVVNAPVAAVAADPTTTPSPGTLPPTGSELGPAPWLGGLSLILGCAAVVLARGRRSDSAGPPRTRRTDIA